MEYTEIQQFFKLNLEMVHFSSLRMAFYFLYYTFVVITRITLSFSPNDNRYRVLSSVCISPTNDLETEMV